MRPLLALAFFAVLGCAPKPDTITSSPPASGGVAPMAGGAAGGLAPVTGGVSVEGSGSGVNQSAIGAAQRAASKSGSAPSLGNEGGE